VLSDQSGTRIHTKCIIILDVMRKPNPIIVFIIHLKTSETYKMIKQSLVMFQVYLFYFRALLSLSCWPCRGLGTTASNNIVFGCKFDPKKLLLDAEHVSS
jgi:hypothetical protein